MKAALEAKGKEVAHTKALVTSTATAISDQKSTTDATIEAVDRAISLVLGDIGSDENDLYVLADVDLIWLNALEAVRSLLYPRM